MITKLLSEMEDKLDEIFLFSFTYFNNTGCPIFKTPHEYLRTVVLYKKE